MGSAVRETIRNTETGRVVAFAVAITGILLATAGPRIIGPSASDRLRLGLVLGGMAVAVALLLWLEATRNRQDDVDERTAAIRFRSYSVAFWLTLAVAWTANLAQDTGAIALTVDSLVNVLVFVGFVTYAVANVYFSGVL